MWDKNLQLRKSKMKISQRRVWQRLQLVSDLVSFSPPASCVIHVTHMQHACTNVLIHVRKWMQNILDGHTHLFEEAKENICMNGPLVSLIQHDYSIGLHVSINQQLSQQHTVCHVLDDSIRTCNILKSNSVPNLEGVWSGRRLMKLCKGDFFLWEGLGLGLEELGVGLGVGQWPIR